MRIWPGSWARLRPPASCSPGEQPYPPGNVRGRDPEPYTRSANSIELVALDHGLEDYIRWLDRWRNQPSIEDEASAVPQPDQAWKALSITNEWIRHADTKTGVTLAFVGATSTVLFNLVKGEHSWTYWLVFAVVLCAAALVAAAAFACAALFPRTKRRARKGTATDEEAVNLLFFGDIVGHYTKDLPSYTQVLSLLTGNPARLTEQIAAQIHENAHIATAKFKHVNRAILAEVGAVGAAAVVAFLSTAGW